MPKANYSINGIEVCQYVEFISSRALNVAMHLQTKLIKRAPDKVSAKRKYFEKIAFFDIAPFLRKKSRLPGNKTIFPAFAQIILTFFLPDCLLFLFNPNN